MTFELIAFGIIVVLVCIVVPVLDYYFGDHD